MTTKKDQLEKTENQLSLEEFNNLIVEAIQDVKGERINIMNLKALSERPAEYFIVCQGKSNTQVKAISERIKRTIKDELNEFPINIEGTDEGKWVLMDYFNVVVHIFLPEFRDFYQLELLWGDADSTIIEDLD